MGMWLSICLDWPRVRISFVRPEVRLRSFMTVVGGRRWRAGWDASVGGYVKAWAGERQDSRQAIRFVAFVVAILIVVLRTPARFRV
jgi:hypothetical protein